MKDDFKKAVRKDIKTNIVMIFFGFLFMYLGYIFYVINDINDPFSLLFCFIGIAFFICALINIVNDIESKHHPEKYELCKRCKCLIKKDKIFCNDCKNSLRRLNKYEEDKKFIKEYANLIKEEKNKEKKDDNQKRYR
jgi:hypothetical protein